MAIAIVEFQKVIGDLLAAELRSRKVRKFIGDRGITNHWSGQYCGSLLEAKLICFRSTKPLNYLIFKTSIFLKQNVK